MNVNEVNAQLDNFASALLKEKGYANLDARTLAQYKGDIIKRALKFLTIMIVQALPDSKLDEYESYLNTGQEQKAQALCRQNIPNFDQFVVDKLTNFRNLYLSK